MSLDEALAWGVAESADKTANVLVGVPESCYRRLVETQASVVLDLTKNGFPVRLVIYACKSYDDGEKQLTETFAELKQPVRPIGERT